MADRPLVNPLDAQAHTRVFDELVEARLAELNTAAVLVYLIDTVTAGALPYLAEQFNVEGLKGMVFAETEEEERGIIKRAIYLNRIKGTRAALREVVIGIGYEGVKVDEGVPIIYNGLIDHGSAYTYGSITWPNLSVIVQQGVNTPITQARLDTLRELIEEFKNARSALVFFGFAVYDDDGVVFPNIAAMYITGVGFAVVPNANCIVMEFPNEVAYNAGGFRELPNIDIYDPDYTGRFFNQGIAIWAIEDDFIIS